MTSIFGHQGQFPWQFCDSFFYSFVDNLGENLEDNLGDILGDNFKNILKTNLLLSDSDNFAWSVTTLDKSLATEDKNMSLLKRDSWSFCRVALPEGHLKLENKIDFGATYSFLKHNGIFLTFPADF